MKTISKAKLKNFLKKEVSNYENANYSSDQIEFAKKVLTNTLINADRIFDKKIKS